MTKVETYIQYIKDKITDQEFYISRCEHEELQYLGKLSTNGKILKKYMRCYGLSIELTSEAEQELREHLNERFSKLAEVLS